MQCVDTIVDGQCNSLQETLEEEVEDVDRVFEEETFLPNEELEIENVMHGQENLLYEDDEEDEPDAYISDEDCDLYGNANDNDDDLSHEFME